MKLYSKVSQNSTVYVVRMTILRDLSPEGLLNNVPFGSLSTSIVKNNIFIKKSKFVKTSQICYTSEITFLTRPKLEGVFINIVNYDTF